MDIYTIVHGFIKEQYSNDPVVLQLMAIDYYLQQKIKPAVLFVQELEKKEKFAVLEKLNLSHHKFRYTVIPINFDYAVFEKENRIVNERQVLIIEYTGTSKPRVVYSARQILLQGIE